MTTPRRLLSNTLVVIVGTATQRLLQFGTTALLARGLGGEVFGQYVFIVAYMFLFSFLVDLGFERVISREIARFPERTGELIGTGLMIRTVLSVIAGIVAVATASLLDLAPLTWWCIVVSAIGLPLTAETLLRAFFQARFQMHYPYLLGLPGGVAFVALAAVVIWTGSSLIWVFLAGLFTGAFTIALMLRIALPQMNVSWRLHTELVRRLFRESWQLGAVAFIWLVALRVDQLLLYWLRDPIELGRYAVAVKVTEAVNLVPEAAMVTVFPLLAATEFSEPDRFDRIYRLTLRYLIALVLPVALMLTFDGSRVLSILFGAEYAVADGALAVLAWWMFFAHTGAVYTNLMIVRSQHRLMALISAIALGLNVAVNLALIPRWGAMGAATATLASSAASFALFSLAPPSRALMQVCRNEAARPLAAAACAAAVAFIAPPALRVLAAPAAYVVFLLGLGGVGRQDWNVLRQLLRYAPRS